MAIDENNIGELAIWGLVIGIIVNLILFGHGVAKEINGQNDNLYPDTIMDMVTDKMPDNYVCEQGDETCDEQLSNVPTEEQGQIDKSQTLINVVPIIGGVLAIIAMTPILPSIIAYQVVPLISDTWFAGLATMFFALWQILNMWMIYLLLFKK